MQGTSGRRLEAIKLVVRIEGLKDRKDRELDLDRVIASAEKIDKYIRTLPKG